jgi:hypothetical protein
MATKEEIEMYRLAFTHFLEFSSQAWCFSVLCLSGLIFSRLALSDLASWHPLSDLASWHRRRHGPAFVLLVFQGIARGIAGGVFQGFAGGSTGGLIVGVLQGRRFASSVYLFSVSVFSSFPASSGSAFAALDLCFFCFSPSLQSVLADSAVPNNLFLFNFPLNAKAGHPPFSIKKRKAIYCLSY